MITGEKEIMANNKKLTIQACAKPSIVITRNALKSERLVYVAVTNRALKYPHGKSCIAYIGTTKAGAIRIASSAAAKAPKLLALHGVTHLEFFVVTCSSRQSVKTWRKLEYGLILAFKHLYGAPPKCNKQGENMKWSDELEYFTRARLEGVIEKYSK